MLDVEDADLEVRNRVTVGEVDVIREDWMWTMLDVVILTGEMHSGVPVLRWPVHDSKFNINPPSTSTLLQHQAPLTSSNLQPPTSTSL